MKSKFENEKFFHKSFNQNLKYSLPLIHMIGEKHES